jgi:hypothetical protein
VLGKGKQRKWREDEKRGKIHKAVSENQQDPESQLEKKRKSKE